MGELRGILARSSIDALEPDLIILDEFQRFRHLLEEPDSADDTRALAHALFDYEGPDGKARTLLLSATPYKMYTLAAEADHDDHYDDFVKTSEFLLGEETRSFRGELRAYREALLDLRGLTPGVLRIRRRSVEKRLRRVMTRMERLAATQDRSGMLEHKVIPPGEVTTSDARAYVAFDAVSRRVGAADPVEYWKSAPYPLSFMEGYDVKRRLRAAASDPVIAADVAGMLAASDGLLDPDALAGYAALDPGNGRLRSVADDLLEAGAWRLLWIPPSLPYYEPRGPYASAKLQHITKRLVFSSWQVVPQAVASVLSYEAERRMMREHDRRAKNTPEARKRIRTLLQFRRLDGRAASMSSFGLVFPSVALARLTDPLEISARLQRKGTLPTAEAVLERAAANVQRELRPFLRETATDGPVDEDWYWAARILLERESDPEALAAFIGRRDSQLGDAWSPGDGDDGDDAAGFGLHLQRAREAAAGRLELGRPPEDLAATLALAGVAGPANVALRALARGDNYREDLCDVHIRDAASRIAWGFRNLFGIPEVMALVRRRSGAAGAYWRRVLEYCLDGNLQATMDEYCHVLPEWLGILQEAPPARAARVAQALYETLTIRAPLYGYEAVRANGNSISLEPLRLRARFALRFGVDATDEAQSVQRSRQVRAAFNSPFWPFVLVTTSVGQEGLDFHQYCHAIVHWNLPANPVDFEQREGRVHRYKGHAVRRNVSARHQRSAFTSRIRDPWTVMFDAASRSPEARRQHDLVPYWVYEGPHRIERYVPVLPMSREIEQLERLKRSLAVYRMVFGQPRQEDLAAYLADQLSSEELAHYQDAMCIDLSPPRRRRILEARDD